MLDVKPRIETNAIYSRRETAYALGVSLSTLKKLIDQGYLEVSRPPGMRRIFIKGESILAMLERTTLNPADEHEKKEQHA
ncbi:MAG: DNA-binding protein [Anaerolineales bacterium]